MCHEIRKKILVDYSTTSWSAHCALTEYTDTFNQFIFLQGIVVQKIVVFVKKNWLVFVLASYAHSDAQKKPAFALIFVLLFTSMLPIVWNAVNRNIKPNPSINTFTNFLSIFIAKMIKCLYQKKIFYS